jgi:hypothetical protein
MALMAPSRTAAIDRIQKSSAFIAPTTQNNPSAAASSGAPTSSGTGVSTW